MAWNHFLNQKAHDIAAFHDQLDEFEIQSHSYQVINMRDLENYNMLPMLPLIR